jgi:hypothetical protein
MRRRGRDQVMTVAAHPAAHWPRQSAQAARLPSQAQRQLKAGGLYQPGQSGDGGLALPGIAPEVERSTEGR